MSIFWCWLHISLQRGRNISFHVYYKREHVTYRFPIAPRCFMRVSLSLSLVALNPIKNKQKMSLSLYDFLRRKKRTKNCNFQFTSLSTGKINFIKTKSLFRVLGGRVKQCERNFYKSPAISLDNNNNNNDKTIIPFVFLLFTTFPPCVCV